MPEPFPKQTATTAQVPPTVGLTEAAVSGPPTIPGYEILGELGRGGMGVVYKALQQGLNRLVALKMIGTRADAPPQAETLARFRREAEAVARLKHPHIVPIYAWGEHQGRPYFVLELIEGRALAALMDGSPWSARRAAELIATLAGALHHAHQHGIVHRDVKPANVLVDEQGRPYLTDFGLARDLYDDDSPTQSGAILGTPAYMAPEQAGGRSGTSGPATDVFGLGAVLYHLLTGRPPYQGGTVEVLLQADWAMVTPPRQLNPALSAGLAAICMKALAAEPTDRHASALVFEQELRRWLGRPRRLALSAVATGCVGVLALLLFLRGRRPEIATELPSTGPNHNVVVRSEALTGELNVRIWALKQGLKRGWKVQEIDRGAVPVRNGEGVRLEARLSRPAYVYLLWVDSEGGVTPMYPWNRGQKLEVTDLAAAPPRLAPEQVVDSPSEVERGWPMEGPSGLETMLLLARSEPLRPDEKLTEILGQLKPAPLVDAREVVVRGFDRDRVIEPCDWHRRPGKQAAEIDDSLQQMMSRLRRHFELVRAVRFAHSAK